ncbi:MAG: acireductone synthase [Sumerlaeia bacterium]
MNDSNPLIRLENDLLESVDVILLDIEGTTTPIQFVTETLFPYARKKMAEFLNKQATTLTDDLRLLGIEHAVDLQAGNNPPSLVVPEDYLFWLMEQDRKSPALKSIQGKIWKAGYESGELKGELYADVAPAVKRWCSSGKRVCIYSSGSVLAQKLLFGNTASGNLLPLLAGHFDTTVGGKKQSASYTKIASELSTDPQHIVFFSDIVEELAAAAEAGVQTILVCRDQTPLEPVDHVIVTNFESL